MWGLGTKHQSPIDAYFCLIFRHPARSQRRPTRPVRLARPTSEQMCMMCSRFVLMTPPLLTSSWQPRVTNPFPPGSYTYRRPMCSISTLPPRSRSGFSCRQVTAGQGTRTGDPCAASAHCRRAAGPGSAAGRSRQVRVHVPPAHVQHQHTAAAQQVRVQLPAGHDRSGCSCRQVRSGQGSAAGRSGQVRVQLPVGQVRAGQGSTAGRSGQVRSNQ